LRRRNTVAPPGPRNGGVLKPLPATERWSTVLFAVGRGLVGNRQFPVSAGVRGWERANMTRFAGWEGTKRSGILLTGVAITGTIMDSRAAVGTSRTGRQHPRDRRFLPLRRWDATLGGRIAFLAVLRKFHSCWSLAFPWNRGIHHFFWWLALPAVTSCRPRDRDLWRRRTEGSCLGHSFHSDPYRQGPSD